MSTEYESMERVSFERVFLMFKRNKVEISHAIRKPFPFLEGLRDNEFITNKTYEDFQDSCRHLVPVQEVIYKALNELEKKFHVRVLFQVFNDVNLENYPRLRPICKSFENVLQTALCSQGGDTGDPNSQLSLEGQAEDYSQGSLTWSPSDPSTSYGWRSPNGRNTTPFQGNQAENCQFSEPQNHTDAYDQDVQLDNRDASLESHSPSFLKEESAELLSHGIHINPCSVQLVDIKKEKSLFLLDGEQQIRPTVMNNVESGVIVLSSDDSDNENICSEDSTLNINWPSKEAREQEPQEHIKPPTLRKTQRSRDSSDTDTVVPRKRRKRANNTRNVKKNPTLGKGSGNIRKRRTRHQNYVIKNIKIPKKTSWKKALPRRRVNPSSRKGRKRGPRILKQIDADFNSPELPVTCGNAKGTLYTEKLKQGASEKSIQSENGRWLTPSEFEKLGKRQQSKKWKQSIRCFGWPLVELIKDGKIPSPPNKRKKEKLIKPCTVCGQQKKVYPCAVCRKFYHKRCHIPPVEDIRRQWCCVFCKTKDQLRCQENQACHDESEVLKRKMSSEEQLKCEQLLLTIYCDPKSRFFIPKPKQRNGNFPDLQKHMWLNKIKNRLNKKAYRSVQRFVEDMRLIFWNHSRLYKNKFNNLGVVVGTIFEENFKRIFSIKETSSQLQPQEHTVLLT